MENIKFDQVKDLRQSKQWSEYLEYLGWKSLKVSDIYIYMHEFGPFKLAKIQRPKKLSPEDLKLIDDVCIENKALFVKVEPVFGQDEKILKQNGYKNSHFPYLPPATLIMDLTKSEETLWKELSHSAKYSINRAKREGAKVEFYQNPSEELIKTFCGLSEQSSKKRNFIDVKRKDMVEKVKIFGNKSYLAVVKNPKGESMVADFFLVHENNAWFLHGGTADIARKGKWGYALIWESLINLKQQGISFLDLEGLDDKRFPHMTKSWAGFSHFKEKFGGEKILYPVPYIKVYNLIFKILEKIYGRLPF